MSLDHALFRECTQGLRSVVLTTHLNPDGDAIGSQIGLARYFTARGVALRIVNTDATPENLRFLEDDAHRAEVYDPAAHDPVLDAADAIVLLDNSAPDRLGRMQAAVLARAAKVLCIDHHPTKATPWGRNILLEGSSATAAMVHDLVREAGWAPDREAATALYVGLATDTGTFRFNSTTPRAHEIAAELMRAGAEPARCYQEIFERNSPAYTRLLGRALGDVRLDAGGAIASVRLTAALIRETGADGVDTSEMTTPILAIDGVRMALLFRELPDHRVKVSLRSKGTLDVHGLATRFGGGGHRNASGVVMKGAMDEVAATILAEAVRTLRGEVA